MSSGESSGESQINTQGEAIHSPIDAFASLRASLAELATELDVSMQTSKQLSPKFEKDHAKKDLDDPCDVLSALEEHDLVKLERILALDRAAKATVKFPLSAVVREVDPATQRPAIVPVADSPGDSNNVPHPPPRVIRSAWGANDGIETTPSSDVATVSVGTPSGATATTGVLPAGELMLQTLAEASSGKDDLGEFMLQTMARKGAPPQTAPSDSENSETEDDGGTGVHAIELDRSDDEDDGAKATGALKSAVLRVGSRREPPLVAAARLHFVHGVTALLEAGAPLGLGDAQGLTALHYAAEYGPAEMVAVLIQAGAPLGSPAAGADGVTPLMCACRAGHEEVVFMLLATSNRPVTPGKRTRGCAINARDQSGDTALMHALYASADTIVSELLLAGADPQIAGLGKSTPLIVAAWGGLNRSVRALLAAGADVNAMNSCGYTALHGAAWHGYPAIAAALLDCGADLYARDRGFSTPTLYALRFDRQEVVRVARAHGHPNAAPTNSAYPEKETFAVKSLKVLREPIVWTVESNWMFPIAERRSLALLCLALRLRYVENPPTPPLTPSQFVSEFDDAFGADKLPQFRKPDQCAIRLGANGSLTALVGPFLCGRTVKLPSTPL